MRRTDALMMMMMTGLHSCQCGQSARVQANADAADLLGSGEALAYAVGTSIAIVDIPRMKIATVLAGCHRCSLTLWQGATSGHA